jgi:hypothetical protein
MTVPTAAAWTATHRGECARCGAVSIIGPDTLTGARATVSTRSAAIMALPVLTDATVWWTCGACDRDNRADLMF